MFGRQPFDTRRRYLSVELQPAGIPAAVIAVLAITGAAVWLFQRSLDKPGGRDRLGGIGDAFGNFIDVFHPSQARATRDLREHDDAGPVTPSPDDDDSPVTLVKDANGDPVAVRIRRSVNPE